MGVVYRAYHEASDHPVALKTVRALAPAWIHGIRREIHALNRIRHPGIVRILDHGVFEGRPWYAMALLEGESLRRRIRRTWSPYADRGIPIAELASATESLPTEALNTAIPVENAGARQVLVPPLPSELSRAKPPVAAGQLAEAVSVVRQICGTLAFLHGEGFINCDLKPENILLVGGQPVIIDFGLSAHHPGGSGRESLEPFQGRAGTKPYMSPEQRRGEFVDARSDLYSVGCILYELIAGRPPIRSTSDGFGLGDRHHGSNDGRVLPPSELVEGVPRALEETVLKLLETRPSDRFGYADEVVAALSTFGGDGPVAPEAPPARPYLYRARFVGRDALMDRLGALREEALLGRGAVALLGGVSGSGKTRLAMEVSRSVPSAEMRVLVSEVSPRTTEAAGPGSAVPLLAVRPFLSAVADLCQRGGAEMTERLLGPRHDVLAPYDPALAQLPRVGPPRPPVTLSPDAARRRLFADLAETLRQLAREKPLLWILDDLGWADELSLSFLQSLSAELLSTIPILLIGTYRTEETSGPIEALAGLGHVVKLAVPRLDQEAVRSMAGDMLALRDPPPDFVQFMERQAEGNPFFLAEYLRAAVAARVVFRKQGLAWQFASGTDPGTPKYADLSLPRPLSELLEHRIRDLSPAAQLMVLAAAVLGREAEIEALYEVAALEEHTAIGALDELLRRQVVEALGAGSIRFAHDKLREVTYAVAPTDRLQTLHGRAARTIEGRLAGDADPSRLWAILGQHFAAAQLPIPAARYLKLAADHARSIYANADAIRLYQDAIDQTEKLSGGISAAAGGEELPPLLALLESQADVLALTGRREDARRAYDRALAQAQDGSAAARSRILRKVGRTWETHHQHAEALRYYAQAQAALTELPLSAQPEERDEWIQVRIDQLWVHYWLNHVAEMDALCAVLEPVIEHSGAPAQRARFYNTKTLRNLRRDSYFVDAETLSFASNAVEACKAGVAPAEYYMAQVTRGLVLLLAGELEAAHEELAGALAYARRAGDSPQQARCLTYITVAARRRSLLEETERFVTQSAAVSTEAGMREYIAAAHANWAWIHLQRGDLSAARTAAREALAIWKQLPAAFPFCWMALLPALEVALTAGDLEDAIACADAVLAAGQQRLPASAAQALREAAAQARAGGAEAPVGFTKALQRLAEARYR